MDSVLPNYNVKSGARAREIDFAEKGNRLKRFILMHPEIFGQLNEYYLSLLNTKADADDYGDFEDIHLTKSDLETVITLLRLRIDSVLKSQNQCGKDKQLLICVPYIKLWV